MFLKKKTAKTVKKLEMRAKMDINKPAVFKKD